MSLRQLLNFVYSWALQRIDPEELSTWKDELDEPYWKRSSRRVVTESVVEDELSAFAAAI